MIKEKRIIITGGHLTPAVALMDELIPGNWKIWYVGRKYSQESDKSISAEYTRILKYKNKVSLLSITTGKLQRYLDILFITSLLKIPIGLLQSLYWLLTIRPRLIVSFGGYVAIPVCITAFLLRIPIITHEQTRSPGLANRFLAYLSKTVCLTWPETKSAFKNKRIEVTGLPIRKVVFLEKEKLEIALDKPLIYISGGSQGSHAINALFEPILKKLLSDFCIVHQCGATLKYNDFNNAVKFKNNLPENLGKRYLPLQYIDEEYLGWLYKHTHFAVSRAGANTVMEFIMLSIPALFIPISWSSSNEQYLNAKLFTDNAAGEILPEEKLNPDVLFNKIYKFNSKVNLYKANLDKLKKTMLFNGADKLASLVENS